MTRSTQAEAILLDARNTLQKLVNKVEVEAIQKNLKRTRAKLEK